MTPSIYKDNPDGLGYFGIEKLAHFDNSPFYEAKTKLGPVLAIWNGKEELPPKLGDKVNIPLNGYGTATVVAYFVENAKLGLEVELEKRPEWHIKQHGDRHAHPLVFGNDIERLA